MKKWLVGLLALASIAATSFAEGTATLPVEENYTATQEWTALTGFSGSGVGTYSDGRCKFDSNNDWLMVQFDGTPGNLSFKVKGNASQTGTSPANFLVEQSADAENWSEVVKLDETAFSTDYAAFGPYALDADSRYVRWTYVNKYGFNLGLNNVEITSGGPAEFSVTFDKENWFKVALGQPSSVTAIPKNGIEPYTFLWDSDTPELKGGTTDTLEIPATLAEGDYTVACLVTEDNGEGDAINALIGFTVEAVPELTGDEYTLVSSVDELQDGTLVVLTDPDNANALKAVVEGSVFAVADVTAAVVDQILTTDDASIVWKLVDNGDGNFSLYNEEAGKNAGHAGGGTSNSGRLQDDPFPNGISLGDDNLFVVTATTADSAGNYRTLQYNYNNGSPRFAYYKGTQKNLHIYALAGASGLTVTFDKANGFTVDLGTPDSITATAKNGVEPYTYAWTSDTPDLNGTGETLEIPATLAAGDYTVMVTVTDAESNVANKLIGFTVAAPAPKFQIACAVGIPNGSVSADKTEAEEGELVTLTATPAAGYKLEHFLVNDIAISANTFPMPAEDVLVSASFIVKPVVAGFAKITSLDELTEGEYVLVGSDTNGTYGAVAELTGSTKVLSAAAVTIEDDVVVDAEESQVWTFAQVEGGWTIFNEAIGYLGYTGSQNSVMAESEPSDKSTWTFSMVEDLFKVANVGTEGRTLRYNYNKGNMRFACYTSDTLPNIGLYKGSSGPATFSIKLDPASYFEVEVGEEASIAATPKNAEGDVHYAWTVDGEPAGSDSAVLGLDTTAATEEIEVVCTATDGADTVATASVSYKVVLPAQKFAVNVAIGILNGSVTTDVSEAAEGDTVTVTATPEAGYRLVEIVVNNGEVAVSGNTFVMPAQDVLVTATFEEKPPVTGDILTNDDVGNQSSSYVEWTATRESGAEYAGQSAGGSKDNPCIQLRTTGSNSGIVMTKAGGSDVTSVTVEWNDATSDGRTLQIYGSANPYTIPANLYDSATQGTLLGTLAKGETTLEVPEGYAYIGIRSSSGALYLTSVAIDFGGTPAAFSIALDPAEDFEVQQGKDAAITATVRGAQGDVSYSWSVNGTPIDLTGNVYAIDSAEIGGPYEVVCEASDGVSDPVSASVSYSVVEAPPVTGDEFTLISSVASLQDGTRVVLTDPDGTLALSATIANSVFTTTAVEPVSDVITTDNANIIWKLVDDGEGNFSLYNEEAGKYAGHAGGGTSNSGRLQDDPFPNAISLDDDGLFVIAATTADSAENYRDLQYNYNSGNARFAYYKGTQKNLRIYAAESGPASPKIVYSGETTIALGGKFEIIFGLLNYDGDFQWEVASREGGTIVPEGRDGLYTWTPTEVTGDEGVTIKVVARSGELDIATKEVVLTVTEPGPQPGEPALVFGGDGSGVVGTPVNFTVEAINMANTDIYGGWVEHEGLFDAPEGSALSDAGVTQDFPNVSFTPDVAGEYVFYFNAGEGDEYREGKWTVIVTDEPGPQPSEAGITKMTIAAGKMTIEFFGEGAQVLVSDDLETWTPVNGAVSPYTIEMGSDPQYIGVR